MSMIVDIMAPKGIGETIRSRRKSLRLTQARLAELAQCSKPTVIAAEAGKPTLQLDVLLRILEILGLTLAVQSANREP